MYFLINNYLSFWDKIWNFVISGKDYLWYKQSLRDLQEKLMSFKI